MKDQIYRRQTKLVRETAKRCGFKFKDHGEYQLKHPEAPFLGIEIWYDDFERNDYVIFLKYDPSDGISIPEGLSADDLKDSPLQELARQAKFVAGLEALVEKKGYRRFSTSDDKRFDVNCLIEEVKNPLDVSRLEKFLKLVGDHASKNYTGAQK